MLRAVLSFYLCLCFRAILVVGNFVSVKGGAFSLNDSPFFFYGTNVFWLSTLKDDELETAFAKVSASGVKVVRTWAFDDVTKKPSSGNYFQVLHNGMSIINKGHNGLQRLDKIVATAEMFGIKLLLTLTNNWNPERANPNGGDTADDLPRGYLSNDYGGMDVYVREFGKTKQHDEFYTNPKIISAFKSYISAVVTRYANNPTIFGWEIANDPRCSSTLPASSKCTTTTITEWAADIAKYIKHLDKQHLVTAGDNGFYCTAPSCHKKFAKKGTKSPLSGIAFDGSSGVDTEDIMSAPCIDFGSFQLFPDQIQYFPDPTANTTINAIAGGNKWVAMHSDSASLIGKPSVMTAFALVSQENWDFYVPFDQSALTPGGPPGTGGVTTAQHDYTLNAWAISSLSGNVGGAMEFQWVTGGLSTNLTNGRRDVADVRYNTPNSLSTDLFGIKTDEPAPEAPPTTPPTTSSDTPPAESSAATSATPSTPPTAPATPPS
ncbi:glycoside hydrolase superfamily [Collybia nuda]|uniref:mannan endo-1,4-beta-mannosidase n=1 Tax=Collybia nuda TaxID=64659 RepID=A0A9P6CFN6_9AGAR|nr:glycoside hydrolase superfamily [Collybia nuda]